MSAQQLRRVLVSGAGGFTGRALCAALLAQGHEVHGLYRPGLPVPASDTASALAATPAGEVRHEVDLHDVAALDKVLSQVRPAAVMHLAACAFAGGDDHLAFYRTNVVGTCNLLDAARKAAVQRVVVASSANVYGVPADGRPLAETAPLVPVNHYGASKLAMEHMARTWQEAFQLIIVRPFNYTGPGQDPAYLVPKLVAHYRQRAAQITLGNLDVARDFTSLDDVVQAYLAVLQGSMESGTFNICSGQAVSLQALLQKLSELTGHHPEIVSTPGLVRRTDIPVLCGDNAQLCHATGWRITQDINRILQEMLR